MEKYHRHIYLCLILHLFRGLLRLKMLNIIQNAHNILNIKCQVYIYLYRCYCVCTVQYWRVYAVHCHLRPVRAEGSYHNKVFTMILYLPPIPHLAVTGGTLELRKLKHIIENRYIYAPYAICIDIFNQYSEFMYPSPASEKEDELTSEDVRSGF